jgi:hypothetical protein
LVQTIQYFKEVQGTTIALIVETKMHTTTAYIVVVGASSCHLNSVIELSVQLKRQWTWLCL